MVRMEQKKVSRVDKEKEKASRRERICWTEWNRKR